MHIAAAVSGFGGGDWDCRILSTPAPGKDHDAHWVAGAFAGVADGVTPLAAFAGQTPIAGVTGPEVRAFALDALTLLAEHSGTSISAANALEQTIIGLWGRPRRDDSPSTCVAWSRLTGDGHIASAVLGDCTIAVRDGDIGTVSVLTDERVAALESATTDAYARLVRSGWERSAALREVRPLLAAQRARVNRPGEHAYYVVADEPAAAGQVRTMRSAITPSMSILLATDGFIRAVNLGICASLPELVARLTDNPDELERIGSLIRAREHADLDCVDYPRASVHDDMTAVLLIKQT